MRSISSFLHTPGSGRRLLATAGMAALAVTGVSVSTAPAGTAAPSLDKAQLAAGTAAAPVAMAARTAAAPAATQSAAHPAATQSAAHPAAAPPKPADWPQLKLSASGTSVFSGRNAVLTATARHHDGTAFAGGALQLQQARNGRWVTVATRKTTANGTLGFTVKVNATGRYRVGVSTIAKVQHAAVSGGVTVNKVDPGTAIVDMTARFAGRPYVFGAAGPRYFDCSGLVLYVYKHVMGINMPHSAAGQDGFGVRISRAQARPGDLIFFRTPAGYVHHVAIYTGSNMMWEAPHTGSYVRHVKIWDNNAEFRRVVQH